jgi:hypothetical protein
MSLRGGTTWQSHRVLSKATRLPRYARNDSNGYYETIL